MGNFKDENAELEQLGSEFIDEGIQRINEGKLKLAEESLTRAKDIFDKISNKRLMSRSLNLLSIVYDEMGNESLDMDCLLDALEMALEDGSYDFAARCYNNVGSKYMNAKAYDRALEYFIRSEEVFYEACEKGQCKEEDNQQFLLIIELNLASIYALNQNIELARKYYEKAKSRYSHPDNEDQQFTFRAFEGLLLWRMGEHDAAKASVDGTIEMARETEYAPDYLELMNYLIDLLKEMNDYSRWECVLNIMETRLKEDGGLNYRMELHKHWLEYYEAIGDDEAYKMACMKFYLLSKEKAVEDFRVAADTIELKVEMRKTAKQKREADSIVYIDSLTGIGNRNKILVDSKDYIEKSIEKKISVSIGIIDIDYFKECNDTYGHIKGDECLKIVAKAIADVVGPCGNVYRYGGDEFLILIPDISESEVSRIGKNIKDSIKNLQIPNSKSPISPFVTLSQGYTQAFAEPGDTIEGLINLADQVLYSVKRCGRNNYKYTHINDIKGGIR